MSRKYNCKHPDRGISRYIERLRRRGLSKAPRMEPLLDLKKRQKIEPIPESEIVQAGWDLGGEDVA